MKHFQETREHLEPFHSNTNALTTRQQMVLNS